MQPAQQLDPGVRAQRLEEAAVHAGKINRPRARHTAHRIRTRRGMPPSYRQNNSSRYTGNGRGGERVLGWSRLVGQQCSLNIALMSIAARIQDPGSPLAAIAW